MDYIEAVQNVLVDSEYEFTQLAEYLQRRRPRRQGFRAEGLHQMRESFIPELPLTRFMAQWNELSTERDEIADKRREKAALLAYSNLVNGIVEIDIDGGFKTASVLLSHTFDAQTMKGELTISAARCRRTLTRFRTAAHVTFTYKYRAHRNSCINKTLPNEDNVVDAAKWECGKSLTRVLRERARAQPGPNMLSFFDTGRVPDVFKPDAHKGPVLLSQTQQSCDSVDFVQPIRFVFN
eukprot:GEMP01035815.1.p1 GENE.GEMP01035815.1~~GEMP01035815.1.p1  ORF type:complete len:237 (+),score=29.22 GEMP01035815.1:173-883(+)